MSTTRSSEAFTPVTRSKVPFPEEFPILLALFHLGNVVRYDPERLDKILDSKACSVVETLRRHATLTFLLAIWSHFSQAEIQINSA
jgi:hypothetical protein